MESDFDDLVELHQVFEVLKSEAKQEDFDTSNSKLKLNLLFVYILGGYGIVNKGYKKNLFPQYKEKMLACSPGDLDLSVKMSTCTENVSSIIE